jgi:F420-dependent oxidoreductase-like protein
MDLRLMVEAHRGATYEQQLAIAQLAEQLGYSAFFRTEHFLAMEGDGRPGPTDSWVTLGAIARETSTIRLGTIMTCATFRHPALLAVNVAQVDQMSRGRVELGIGAGWFDREHTAMGVPFPPMPERYDRYVEQIEILEGLWHTADGDTFDYAGTYYQLSGNPALPRPYQDGGPPLVIGGMGAKRTPALAARHAHEFNSPFSSADVSATHFRRVREACAEIDRDPAEIIYSIALPVMIGETEAEVDKRIAQVGMTREQFDEHGISGLPDAVAERLNAYAAVGAQRCYAQVLDLDDLDHVELLHSALQPLI